MTGQTDDRDFTIIGKIPSGLFIVGVGLGNRKEAFLASWISQVSLNPVRLSVVMEADRPTFALAQEAGYFTVNVLGETNTAQMKPFWGGLKSGIPPLDRVAHTLTPSAALLIEGVLGYAHCQIEAIHALDGHRLVLGKVVENAMLNPEDKPKVHIRNKGTSY